MEIGGNISHVLLSIVLSRCVFCFTGGWLSHLKNRSIITAIFFFKFTINTGSESWIDTVASIISCGSKKINIQRDLFQGASLIRIYKRR